MSDDRQNCIDPVELLWRELYKAHVRFVNRHVRSRLPTAPEEVIQDIVQDTFIRVYRYRRNLPEIGGGDPVIATYLRKTADRQIIAYWKEKKPASLDEIEGVAGGDDTVDLAERQELQEIVHQAVAALPERLQEVVVLVYLDGQSYRDTAEQLGIPIGTVKSRLYEAKQELKPILTHKLEGYLEDHNASER